MRPFRAPDGVEWTADVLLPGSSNALVMFHHPDGRTARRDRYNWYITTGPESHNVTARLDPHAVLNALSERELLRLFLRSMPVSRRVPDRNLAVGEG